MSTHRIAVIDASEFDTLATFEAVMVRTRELRAGMILVDEDGIAHLELMHRVGSIGHGCVAWAAQDVDSIRTERVSFAVSRVANVRVATVRFAA